MKRDVSLAVVSFVVTIGVILGIWSGLNIDLSARKVGFSSLGIITPRETSAELTVSEDTGAVISFLSRYPQLIPYPIRIGIWSGATLWSERNPKATPQSFTNSFYT